MSLAYDADVQAARPKPVGLGHNSGLSLRDMLLEQHALIIKRADELRAAEKRLPEITDDETLGDVADFTKQLTACVKTLDRLRVDEKEPFLSAGREVDGVFKAPIDALETVKAGVAKKMKTYLDEKARRELEARKAEERARQEEARRQEETRRKAEAERVRAEEEARKAEEELQRLSRKRKQDEEATAKAMAEAEAARQRQIEAEAAAEAERKRAEEAEARRIEAEKLAQAKPADMARTRGDMGAVGTLRRKWVHEIVDWDQLNLNDLKPWLTSDVIAKAIDAAIRNGVRPGSDGAQPIAGVRIFETTIAQVR